MYQKKTDPWGVLCGEEPLMDFVAFGFRALHLLVGFLWFAADEIATKELRPPSIFHLVWRVSTPIYLASNVECSVGLRVDVSSPSKIVDTCMS